MQDYYAKRLCTISIRFPNIQGRSRCAMTPASIGGMIRPQSNISSDQDHLKWVRVFQIHDPHATMLPRHRLRGVLIPSRRSFQGTTTGPSGYQRQPPQPVTQQTAQSPRASFVELSRSLVLQHYATPCGVQRHNIRLHHSLQPHRDSRLQPLPLATRESDLYRRW